MPVDLLFSTVFFFFWWKLMYVLAAATGVSEGYGGRTVEAMFPYANEQMFGGFIAIALGSALLGRRYLRHVWLRAIGRPSEVEDAGEGMSFRAALLGTVLGLGALTAFAIHGGMTPGLAGAAFLIYALLSLAVARIRAEFGSPIHDFHWTGPDYTLTRVLGTVSMRQRDVGMLNQLYWFNRAYRAHPIASSLEGLQMSARAEASGRPIVVAVLAAGLMTAVVGFWGWLHYAYKLGAASAFGFSASYFGNEELNRFQSWIQNPMPANVVASLAMGGGFAVAMLLGAARARFAGWPLHPVAYALSASWSIHLVWTPMLIAWLVKLIILRYGGLRFYRRGLPFFFGLILGESVVGCSWSLIGLVFDLPSYNFFGY
jgi:hypothetical protein